MKAGMAAVGSRCSQTGRQTKINDELRQKYLGLNWLIGLTSLGSFARFGNFPREVFENFFSIKFSNRKIKSAARLNQPRIDLS